MATSDFEDDFKQLLASTSDPKGVGSMHRQISFRLNPLSHYQIEMLAERTKMTKTGLAEYLLEKATTIAWKAAGLAEMSYADLNAIKASEEMIQGQAVRQDAGEISMTPDKMLFSRINCIRVAFQHIGLEVGRASNSQAVAASLDNSTRICCLTSQDYDAGKMSADGEHYWFTIYERQLEDIQRGQHAYIALGCGSTKQMVLIPADEFSPWCADLPPYTQGKKGWHIHLRKISKRWELRREGRYNPPIDVTKFAI